MGSQGHAAQGNAVARPGGDSSLDDSVRLFIQLDQDGMKKYLCFRKNKTDFLHASFLFTGCPGGRIRCADQM